MVPVRASTRGNQVVTISFKHIIGSLIYHKHKVCSNEIGLLISFLRKRDLGALLPARLHLMVRISSTGIVLPLSFAMVLEIFIFRSFVQFL